MKKEKDKKFIKFERKVDITGIIIILALLTFSWTINNNMNSMSQRIDETNLRIDGVYEILIKSDKSIVDMKKGIDARFANIEEGLATIETGIISLQPRDDSLKEDKPHTETAPYIEDKPHTETAPYIEGESGQKTSPYQSP